MKSYREVQRAKSNNDQNPNKNICAMQVAKAFGCAEGVRYLHNWDDMKRAIGKRFSFRSRLSKLGKTPTVGNSRKKILDMIREEGAVGAVVMVPGHVISWDAWGNLTDTAPRVRDRRRVLKAYLVFRPAGC